MRKPRDIDSELRALDHKARQLRARKVAQLGELVIGCGADTLPIELLAGALLAAMASQDTAEREAWRARGAAFFSSSRGSARRHAGDRHGAAPPSRKAPSPAGAADAT